MKYLIVIFVCVVNVMMAQKQSISLMGTYYYTKTDIQNYRETHNTFFQIEYAQGSLPDQGIWGYYYGINYGYLLNPKLKITLGYAVSLKGQKCKVFTKYKDFPQVDTTIKRYYDFRYYSREVMFNIQYRIKQLTPKLSLAADIGLGYDSIEKMEGQNYQKKKTDCRFGTGCCSEDALGGYRDYRGSLLGGVTFEYQLNRYFSLSLSPRFTYYSDVQQIKLFSPGTLLDKGNMFTTGTLLMINFNW